MRKSPIITDNIFVESDKIYTFRNDTNKTKWPAWRNSERTNCSDYMLTVGAGIWLLAYRSEMTSLSIILYVIFPNYNFPFFMGVKLPVLLFNWHKPLSYNNYLTVLITACYLKHVNLWHLLWTKECCEVWRYRSFATRVSQLKIWHFLVTGTERNVCRCTFNRYSVITQFAKLAAGERLCCNFQLWHCCRWHCCRKWAILVKLG